MVISLYVQTFWAGASVAAGAAGAQAVRTSDVSTIRKAIFLNMFFSPGSSYLLDLTEILIRYNRDTRRCLSWRDISRRECLPGDANR